MPTPWSAATLTALLSPCSPEGPGCIGPPSDDCKVKNFLKNTLLGWGVLLAGVSACAGEFSVNPVRLELGAAARSGAITVRNEGKQPLSFQLQAMEWTQDANGKDQYLETADIIFFPKIMTIAPDEEGVVRVGTRTPAVPVEKTYRLFIEELPGSAQNAPGSPQITFLIKFGAPIFVTPLKPQDGLELSELALAKGEVTLATRNTGNRHQVVQGIVLTGADASGQPVYSMTLADRYLLAGAAKPYASAIPADQCARIASLAVEYKTDKLSARRQITVTRAMCSAQ